MELTDILAWINAVLALLLAIFALRYIRQANARARWLKLFYALLGFYWCGLYIFVALTEPDQFMDSVLFGQVFVRPAFTWTLGLMAAGAMYRWRSLD